jgi:hypothetical protein
VRQGQQNRRGRGRNNNRKGHHNPLSRSFESNGPDVKIRGTPSHIAEKYISLARDAQSTGDPVLAENYLQHAEHYSRIIMAYREQLNQPGDAVNGGGHRMRVPADTGESLDDIGDDAGQDLAAEDGFPQPVMPQAPLPMRPHGGEHGRQDRPFRRDQNRPRYADRGERHAYGDRDRQSDARLEPQDRAPEQDADGGEPRRRDRFQQPHEQPEFLRRPVRRVRSENGDPGKGEPPRD